jgi:hypothetical protein
MSSSQEFSKSQAKQDCGRPIGKAICSKRFLVIFFFSFFFLVVLGFELRASHLLRQVLYYLNPAFSPFCSDHFGDRVSLFAHVGLDQSSYFRLPTVAGMLDACHHAQPLIENGSFFFGLG